jgi:hypothetical protein
MVIMVRYSVVVLAGLWAASSAVSATWADRLFEEMTKDFGSVPRGPALTHPFRVVNNTSNVVHIANIRVSCGCVTATPTRTYLNPGEETAVVARMDTTRFRGPKSVTIYVQFDRPSVEEVRLWVQAIGRDDFNLAPDTLSFGQVKRGSKPSGTVTITFYGNSTSQIVEVKTDTNYLKTSLREVVRQPSLVQYELTAGLRADAPVGKWYSDLWLKTNNPNLPQIRVPLTVDVESALSISPDAVVMGYVKTNSELERRVIVRGVKPFKITSIDGTDNELLVQDTNDDAKKAHVVTVKLRPARTGDIRRTIRLHTDLDEENEIDFQVSAKIVP